MKTKKKGEISLEYLAAFIIVIVVVAIIIYWVSTRMSQSGEQVDGFFDDNGDRDGDGILNIIDEEPCGPGSTKDDLKNERGKCG